MVAPTETKDPVAFLSTHAALRWPRLSAGVRWAGGATRAGAGRDGVYRRGGERAARVRLRHWREAVNWPGIFNLFLSCFREKKKEERFSILAVI